MFTLIKSAAIGVGITLLACTSFAQQLPATEISFDIKPLPLPDALNVWAQQAGLQVLWRHPARASQLMAPRVVGERSPQSVLEFLLQETGFAYSIVDQKTVKIRREVRAERMD